MADLEGGTTLSLDRHLGASDTAEAIKSYTEIEIPESLRDNLVLFLRMERKVLKEYDPAVCALFDRLFNSMIRANEGNPGTVAADEPTDAQGIPTADTEGARAFREAVELIDALPVDQAQVVVRAFTSFFHLANLSEENYRVETLRELERNVSMESAVDTSNELVVAYGHLLDEVGPERTAELLGRLEFHPVFTAHPTEARRKAVEGKIRRIAALLDEHPYLGGSALLENERHMLQEIDALVRTSPTELRPWKRPTPSSTSSTTRCSIQCRRCTGVSTTGCWARTPAACRPCARRSSVRAAGSGRTATGTRTSQRRCRAAWRRSTSRIWWPSWPKNAATSGATSRWSRGTPRPRKSL